MADAVTNAHTPLPVDEVLVRAVQFFSTERWKVTSQSTRTVTFEGRPPFPWAMVILTALGLAFCVVPGVILYFALVRKSYRFSNLVVTANSAGSVTEISISHPDWSAGLVNQFVAALPAAS